ncbi:lytic transglycosylase domain-containing protein [Thermodesulfobacterium sp. TA1]|uniref:lytic transglycosylase domain-containing protein n=1 Tax=Thermodesulfobacterium sp. TA1 TaxID=2234087 RepID=UPI001231DD3A|nr:lytic transglycosylase domain-containing protein [Thermodesulfobacterium sp. TA1]QER42790.1 lytic transglycosylase domain-containing protein [Thermodesulfobacterium sp. TA1]
MKSIFHFFGCRFLSLVISTLIFNIIFWFLSGFSLAHIYRCKDPETGEEFFTNSQKFLSTVSCQLVLKERPKILKNLSFKPSGTNFSFYTKVPSEYEEWFERIGRAFSLDPALLKAIAKVESSFNPRAVSPKGAMGIMQLMPQTARLVGVEDPYHPLENLKGGAKYLRMLLDEFQDLTLALAAYNAGPEKVKTYRGIPPYPETQNYVKNVLYYYSLFKR